MAPEGGHIGFDLTIFIVFGLSLNFYSGYNIAKEVDWAVCPQSFFRYFSFNFRFTSKSSTSVHSSRKDEQDVESRFLNFEFHFCSALTSKIRKNMFF